MSHPPRGAPPRVLPPPVGPPLSVTPPAARDGAELGASTDPALPPRRRAWTFVVGLALVVVLGGLIFTQTRGKSSGPATVCNQLSLPGLTTREGQQILNNAFDRGITADQLRQQCRDLVDQFGAP